ncbi:MAG: hemerythrin domain-containing protein [Rhodocyclaceae bacterium]|nr:hemerythrin domain-containing protein [Rhodocyclaceae bacterium]
MTGVKAAAAGFGNNPPSLLRTKAAMTSITEPLREQHKHCDDLFAAAEEAAQSAHWVECKAQFAEFRSELEAHFSGEETVLFPAFEQASGMSGGPTQVMRMEHTQMRGLVEQMAGAVDTHDAAEFCGAGETLLMLMQQHNMKEENILYPMCDQTLAVASGDVEERLKAVIEKK